MGKVLLTTVRRILRRLNQSGDAIFLVLILSLGVLNYWLMDKHYQAHFLGEAVIRDMYPRDRDRLRDRRECVVRGGCERLKNVPAFPREQQLHYSSCWDCGEPNDIARVRVTYDDGSLTYAFLDGPEDYRGKTLVFRIRDGAWSCSGGTLGWPNRPRECE